MRHIFALCLALAPYLFTYLKMLVKRDFALPKANTSITGTLVMFILLIKKENLEHLKTLGVEEGHLGYTLL